MALSSLAQGHPIPMPGSTKRILSYIGQCAAHISPQSANSSLEFGAAWPVFLFFTVGFLLLLLIIKLALANFSIEVTALSKAVVGALCAAKAVLILDETPLARRLEHYRRIVAVAVKILYDTKCWAISNDFVDALRRVHSFDSTVRYMIDQANLYRILSWVLGVILVFAIYFALFEINKRMGEGELWKLFFDSPKTTGESSRHSEITAGDSRICRGCAKYARC